MCWWTFVLFTIVNQKHKVSLETSTGKERATRPVSSEKPSHCHFEIYIPRVFLGMYIEEYLNLFNHILILCITTSVNEKETHIRINRKSSAAFKRKSVCSCIVSEEVVKNASCSRESLRGHH